MPFLEVQSRQQVAEHDDLEHPNPVVQLVEPLGVPSIASEDNPQDPVRGDDQIVLSLLRVHKRQGVHQLKDEVGYDHPNADESYQPLDFHFVLSYDAVR